MLRTVKGLVRIFCFVWMAVSALPGVCAGNEMVDKVVVSYNETAKYTFIKNESLYHEGWDTLAQPIFWKQVIRLTSDTCLVNVAYCRKPVDKVSRTEWMNLTEDQKKKFK